MRRPTTFLPVLALGVAGAISVADPSPAAMITYTETATGSGCLGLTTPGTCSAGVFTNANVTLTMVNDTTNVIGSPPGAPTLFENFGTLTVSVDGVGSATLADPSIEVFSSLSPAPATVGFSDVSLGFDILDTENDLFPTYALDRSVGFSGAATLSPPIFFPITGGGFFNLSSVVGPTSTFAATTSAIPEASSLALLGIALAGLGIIRRRKMS